MAKNLITTNISGSVKAPFSKAALDNLQANIPEISSAIIQGMIGSYTTNDVIILYGFAITLTVSGTVATWTKGAVYYNGEIYQVAPGTLTKASGVFLYSISDVPTSAAFSDGNSYPWIDVRTITITSGTSGTGIADYGAASVKLLSLFTTYQRGALSNISLANSYAVATGGTSGSGIFKYGKDSNGTVRIVGSVVSPSSVTSVTVGNLPDGFRPQTPKVFTVNSWTSGQSGCVCYIETSGEIRLYNGSGLVVNANATFWLDVVNFNVLD